MKSFPQRIRKGGNFPPNFSNILNKMIFPLKKWNSLKRGYLFRQPTFYSKHHLGLDLIARKGTPVYAPCDGRVETYIGKEGGNIVEFYFNKYIMRVLHLSKFGNRGKVKEGDIIGYVGNTGLLSRGSHAHIDISKNKVDIYNIDNFIDPEVFFSKINDKDMRYVIYGRDQYLLDDKLKIAFSIADEQDLGLLIKRGLTGAPEKVNNLDGYLVYHGSTEERLREFFNLGR